MRWRTSKDRWQLLWDDFSDLMSQELNDRWWRKYLWKDWCNSLREQLCNEIEFESWSLDNNGSTYPLFLNNYRWLSIFAESFTSVMHHTSIIAWSVKWVNSRLALLVKIFRFSQERKTIPKDKETQCIYTLSEK